MKVFCIGRNYADHAKELNNPVPKEPVIFMKPATAVCSPNVNIYYPEFTDDLHYECEVVVRICKNGRNIPFKHLHQYYDAWTVGIDFTARDIQNRLKKEGLPWELAKSFDNSALVGRFLPIDDYKALNRADFSLAINDVVVQKGNTADMIFSIDQILHKISKYFTVQIGDYIFTGTPAGTGPVLPYDKLVGTLNGEQLFEVELK